MMDAHETSFSHHLIKCASQINMLVPLNYSAVYPLYLSIKLDKEGSYVDTLPLRILIKHSTALSLKYNVGAPAVGQWVG